MSGMRHSECHHPPCALVSPREGPGEYEPPVHEEASLFKRLRVKTTVEDGTLFASVQRLQGYIVTPAEELRDASNSPSDGKRVSWSTFLTPTPTRPDISSGEALTPTALRPQYPMSAKAHTAPVKDTYHLITLEFPSITVECVRRLRECWEEVLDQAAIAVSWGTRRERGCP